MQGVGVEWFALNTRSHAKHAKDFVWLRARV